MGLAKKQKLDSAAEPAAAEPAAAAAAGAAAAAPASPAGGDVEMAESSAAAAAAAGEGSGGAADGGAAAEPADYAGQLTGALGAGWRAESHTAHAHMGNGGTTQWHNRCVIPSPNSVMHASAMRYAHAPCRPAPAGKYDLIGVLTHKGRSADSGHYVAWVKQVGRLWRAVRVGFF